jgi:hypothetical protein
MLWLQVGHLQTNGEHHRNRQSAIGNQKYAFNQKYDAFVSESLVPWSWLGVSTVVVSIGAKIKAGLAGEDSTDGLGLAAKFP